MRFLNRKSKLERLLETVGDSLDPANVLKGALSDGIGSGNFSGMAVDECGNLYVGEYAGRILRIAPDGLSRTVIYRDPGAPIHNVQWSRGGDWGATRLYVVLDSEEVRVLDVGVRGKLFW